MRKRMLFTSVALALIACAPRPVPPPGTPTACDPGQLSAAPNRDVIEKRVAQKRGSMGHATHSMVASGHVLATRVGRRILAEGGNAVDAFVAAVLVEDMVLPGVTSTAGLVGYLVAPPGQKPTYVHGPYRTPPRKDALWTASAPSGRAVLLPGAIVGLLEGQARYGKLTRQQVLAPVIELARDGFAIDKLFASAIRAHAQKLLASPYAARTFFVNGAPLEVGARLQLPELAATLARIAEHGTDEIKRGEWARAFVAEANAHGGALELADLAGVGARFEEAGYTRYRGREVYTAAGGSFGGARLRLSLALLEHADLPRLGPIERSSEALGLFLLTHRAVERERWTFDTTQQGEALTRRIHERAEALWPGIRDGKGQPIEPVAAGHHSSAVIVVDAAGAIVAGTHTIETLNWGEGLFAGGIPLGTAGSVALGGGQLVGADLPDPLSVSLVYEDGAPRLALAVFGTGLHPADVQLVSGILDLGRDLESAVLAPRLGWFSYDVATQHAEQGRNLLDPRVPPEILCRLGPLGASLQQTAEPGYPPGILDLGFPVAVELRGTGADRVITGMTPEWLNGLAEGD